MKDSPAACATLGMNLMFTKLAVFAISAGIAGLGGALIGGLQRSTNSQNWEFVGRPADLHGRRGRWHRADRRSAVRRHQPRDARRDPDLAVARIDPGIANITTVTPGFMGIGLGRNPNGAVADIREGFEPLPKRKIEFSLFLVSLAALYAIVLVADIHTWWFVVGGVTLLIGFTLVAGLRARPAPETEAAAGVEFADVPLEWVGIDRPFTPEDVRGARRAARPRRGELMALLDCRGDHRPLRRAPRPRRSRRRSGRRVRHRPHRAERRRARRPCSTWSPASSTRAGGSVRLGGRDITRCAPYKRARLGIARTFQRLELFALLSVRENVRVAAEVRRDYARAATNVAEIERSSTASVWRAASTTASTSCRPDRPASSRSAARSRTRPRVLLLDEPASGLDESETDHLGALLRTLRAEGMASCSSSTTCSSSWRCAT